MGFHHLIQRLGEAAKMPFAIHPHMLKPADLAVIQASKFELIINLKAAKMIGLTLSPDMLSIADEVIE